MFSPHAPPPSGPHGLAISIVKNLEKMTTWERFNKNSIWTFSINLRICPRQTGTRRRSDWRTWRPSSRRTWRRSRRPGRSSASPDSNNWWFDENIFITLWCFIFVLVRHKISFNLWTWKVFVSQIKILYCDIFFGISNQICVRWMSVLNSLVLKGKTLTECVNSLW